MKTASKILAAALVAGVAVVAGQQAEAATAATTLDVSANVTNNCSIAQGAAMNFTYSGAQADSSGTVLVTCTAGMPGVTVFVGDGQNPSGTPRMRNGAGTDFLGYQMYTDATYATVYPRSAPGFGLTPTGAAQTVTVFGRIPANQNVPAGTYTDQVTVTVNY